MERFANEKEAAQFVRERREAFSGRRNALENYMCDKVGYYENFQLGLYHAPPSGSSTERLRADLHPESLTFQPQMNRTSRFTQRAATATAPVNIECEVLPSSRDTSVEGAVRSQTLEDLTSVLVKHSNLVCAWDDANFLRSVMGAYMVGWSLRPDRGDGEPDCRIEAFRDHVLKLSLDPYVTNRNLHEHEEVLFSDAWSIPKLQRRLGPLLKKAGISLKPDDLRRIGDLCTFEIAMARHTDGGLFGQYQEHSDTRAAIVHELYRKDASGRFTNYSLFIELGNRDEDMRLLNTDDQTSPWGGIGLPMVLLQGHRRGEGGGPFGIGEVAMMQDDQDRLNRLNRWRELQERQASKHMTLVDENAMGPDKRYEVVARRITNAIGGIVTWNSGHAQMQARPPQVLSIPAPNGHFGVEIQESERAMREQSHRAAIHSGETQTHTPLGAVEIARDEAGQVLDKRVDDDRKAMARLIEVGTLTEVRMVRQASPGTLSLLRRCGFDATDLGVISTIDPVYCGAEFRVREGSVRIRSTASKKADLDGAVERKAMTPQEWRRELAGSSLDLALTQEDRFYTQTFEKAAYDLVTGRIQQWVPIPIGARTLDLVEAFRHALVDRRTPPDAKARLAQAITDQQLFTAQEAAMLQPQQPTGGAEASAQQPLPPAGTIEDLVAQLAPQVNQAA